MTITPNLITKSIGSANNFTEALQIDAGEEVDVSVSGTFVGTATVQRSFDGGATWLDLESYTVPTEKILSAASRCLVRVGVKTGAYTSGSVLAVISMG